MVRLWLVKSLRWRDCAEAFPVEQTMPSLHFHMPNKPHTLYRMVQYFMSLKRKRKEKKKLPSFPNIPLCVLTHTWELQLDEICNWEDETSLPAHIPRSDDDSSSKHMFCGGFQCLWKLFKGSLNLFQIYQELILALFFFWLPSLPFF